MPHTSWVHEVQATVHRARGTTQGLMPATKRDLTGGRLGSPREMGISGMQPIGAAHAYSMKSGTDICMAVPHAAKGSARWSALPPVDANRETS